MKQSKKLTRNLKVKLSKKGFDPDLYRLTTETADTYELDKINPNGKDDHITLHKH